MTYDPGSVRQVAHIGFGLGADSEKNSGEMPLIRETAKFLRGRSFRNR